MGKHFLGDYKPVNVYRNNVKLAGWLATEKTGEAISYTDTYNDKFNSLIADGAEPQSLADWHGVSGALTQGGTPTPTAPVAVTPNILAGSYKIARPAGGWWLITLTDDIRGIDIYSDKIEVDVQTGKGKERKYIQKRYLKDFSWSDVYYSGRGMFHCNAAGSSTWTEIGKSDILFCSHFKPSPVTWGYLAPNNIQVPSTLYSSRSYMLCKPVIPEVNSLATWLVWLNDINPELYYLRPTETVTDLTLTHTDTSDLPELTLADLGITTSSLDYPFTIYESNNNLISISNATEVKQTVSLPTLRAIGTVKDRYDILSGVKTKKISEWINPADYAMTATPQTGYMQMFTPVISGALASSAIHGYKYSGAKLGNGMTAIDYGKVHTDGTICITAAPTDTGWGVSPTAAEVKAYFLGWQMCHDDGSAPYYKSEVPYTPSTWAEWTKYSGVTVDSTVANIPMNSSGIRMSTTLKVSTKYSFLFNIVSNGATKGGIRFNGDKLTGSFLAITVPGEIGNKKFAFTTLSTISNNNIILYFNTSVDLGTTISIKDFRIYELPTGSQIEADFNTMTADQLAIKYPFYGLNPNNWKHITDGTGLTATLPTATYAGYTPYRLLYQLATPAEEQLTGTSVPTYPWHTDIAQTGDVLTTVTANAKVMD